MSFRFGVRTKDMVRVGLKVGARVRVGGKVRFFYMGVGLGLRLSAMTRRYCVITHQEVYVWVGLVYDD